MNSVEGVSDFFEVNRSRQKLLEEVGAEIKKLENKATLDVTNLNEQLEAKLVPFFATKQDLLDFLSKLEDNNDQKKNILFEVNQIPYDTKHNAPSYYCGSLLDTSSLTIDFLKVLRLQLRLGSVDYLNDFVAQYGIQFLVNALRWIEYKCSSLWCNRCSESNNQGNNQKSKN